MIIGEIIDGIFKCLRYGVWGMSVLGIVISLIMIFANFGLGFASVAICIALLLMCISLAMLLMPKNSKFELDTKKIIIGVVLILLAIVVVGITYFSIDGFPALNLLFMKI